MKKENPGARPGFVLRYSLRSPPAEEALDHRVGIAEARIYGIRVTADGKAGEPTKTPGLSRGFELFSRLTL
jgi:hypothetical protein